MYGPVQRNQQESDGAVLLKVRDDAGYCFRVLHELVALTGTERQVGLSQWVEIVLFHQNPRLLPGFTEVQYRISNQVEHRSFPSQKLRMYHRTLSR